MQKWLLVGILLLGLTTRLIGLGNHPAGFTPDEASFGYDAYSILKTGKDQWGVNFPLVLRSFGDFKLPVYTYLAIPTVALFGLSEFAVRLPNALLGSAAILVTYYLARRLFDERVALVASLLLAISPWHILLSRGAFEANLTTFFLPLGILLFLSKRYSWAALVFGLNLFTYHTARLLTPVIVGYLLWRNWRQIPKSKLNLAAAIFGIFLIGAFYFYLVGGSRLASSGIFDLPFGNDRYLVERVGEPNLIAKIFYNQPVFIARQFLNNYLSYFSPQFLLTQGPAEGTYGMVPGIGVVYLIEVVFLAGFIIKLIRQRTANLGFLVFWLAVSPIPAALTKGPGYAANRAAFMLPALPLISAIGAVYVFNLLSKKINPRFLVWLASGLLLVNVIIFAEKYVAWQPASQSVAMLAGRQETVAYVLANAQNYQEIVVSRSLSEPQIYFAFFAKIDPSFYQQQSQGWLRYAQEGKSFVDQLGEYHLGNYTFADINYPAHRQEKGTLLVGKPEEFPSDVKPLKVIYYPSGEKAIEIVEI